MNRAFVITAVLLLNPFPAFSQTAAGGEGRDSSYSRKDRDLEDILRGIGDHGREGRAAAAAAPPSFCAAATGRWPYAATRRIP